MTAYRVAYRHVSMRKDLHQILDADPHAIDNQIRSAIDLSWGFGLVINMLCNFSENKKPFGFSILR